MTTPQSPDPLRELRDRLDIAARVRETTTGPFNPGEALDGIALAYDRAYGVGYPRSLIEAVRLAPETARQYSEEMTSAHERSERLLRKQRAAEAELMKLADELVQESGGRIKWGDAWQRVCAENPELFDRYNARAG